MLDCNESFAGRPSVAQEPHTPIVRASCGHQVVEKLAVVSRLSLILVYAGIASIDDAGGGNQQLHFAIRLHESTRVERLVGVRLWARGVCGHGSGCRGVVEMSCKLMGRRSAISVAAVRPVSRLRSKVGSTLGRVDLRPRPTNLGGRGWVGSGHWYKYFVMGGRNIPE